jgi:signal transduction histidine kinase
VSAGRVLVTGAGAIFAVASVGAGFGWGTPGLWIPDLITGMAFVIAGAALGLRMLPGILLVGCGFAWFAAGFWPGALFWHRGPLVHLLLTAPGARAGSRPAWLAVMLGYLVSAFPSVWGHPLGSVLLSTGLVVWTVQRAVKAPLRERRGRVATARASVTLALVLGCGAVLEWILPAGAASEPVLLAYQAVLLWVGITLARVNRPPRPGDVVDLVVDLGQPVVPTLEQRLASWVGDPGLRLGMWRDGGPYVDEAGEPVVVEHDDRVTSTLVDWEGERFALLVHDRSVLADPMSREAVASATRLLARNETLRAEALAEVAELKASRRRLLAAGDGERRRVEHELRSGVGHRLEELDDLLAAIVAEEAESEHLGRAREYLAEARRDLERIAHRLSPPELSKGLPAALGTIAARSPLPVDVRVEGRVDGVPSDLGVTVYYVCAEGLANVVKHAAAGTATVVVSRTGEVLRVVVEDDGVGPVDAGAAGSGLDNLRHRARESGGRVRLERAPGGGARLVVELPLDHQE